MIENVSDTAFWVATHRADESDRPDALFHDPLARRLSGEHGKTIAASMPRPEMTAWSVVVRTVIIDEYIADAILGGVDVVVNLGAGLDTRPYRLPLPATLRWIEVDQSSIIDYKERVLSGEQPRCSLERLSIDLTNAALRREFLQNTGASASRMLVLTEGVMPYLSVSDGGALADDLAATPNLAYWIVDYFSAEAMKRLRQSPMQKKLHNAPFQFIPDNWFEFFRTRGWKPKEMRYLAIEGYKRRRPIPLPWIYRLLIKLMPAERRMEGAQSTGYALLERA